MKKLFVLVSLSFCFLSVQSLAEDESLACDIGPVVKTFGGTDWNVYSCTDKETVVIVTASENPASPFYFVFYTKDGGYKLSGEGTGDKKYTQLAFDDLSKLSPEQIEVLIKETLSPE